MRNGVTQNRWQNEHKKVWIFHEIAKWRRWQLMLLWNGDGGDWCSTDGKGICHRLAPSFFEEMTTLPMSKTSPEWPGYSNDWLKFRKYRTFLLILHLFTSTRSRLMLRGWWQRQLSRTCAIIFRIDDTLPTSKTSPEMTSLPSNPNGLSKFCKYRAYLPILLLRDHDRWSTASEDRSNGT